MDNLGVVVMFSRKYSADGLKGYCLSSNRTIYVVINDFLCEAEKRVVAMHELGHVVLHRHMLQVTPMRDFELYGMQDKTEYEANLFAADCIIPDTDLEMLAKNGDEDYFDICKILCVNPDLLSFKLWSLIQRGYSNYNLPQNIKSGFLKSF
ncbi:MAG: ImmA/IrrE family metallo-endopeptidase [Clostridia bacterium]|nr:ImmA/IrrE family metallo-endopeptidase [Clostridia bacterium]